MKKNISQLQPNKMKIAKFTDWHRMNESLVQEIQKDGNQWK